MNRSTTARFLLVCACVGSMSVSLIVSADEYVTGIQWDKPPVVRPGNTNSAPPSDAVVLFGKAADASKWVNGENWTTEGDEFIAGKGKIITKAEFGDCQLHVEWSAPLPVKGDGQGRGNSGIFFMDTYELQVLDSYKNPTYYDGQAGSIYKQTPPQVNAMRPPGEWNTYDILWTAPRFDPAGRLISPAYITAIHNGVLIQNHFELRGDTPYTRPPEYKAHGPKGPISIQDHNNPVRFRNIWVRPLKPANGVSVRQAGNIRRYKPEPATKPKQDSKAKSAAKPKAEAKPAVETKPEVGAKPKADGKKEASKAKQETKKN